MNFLLSLVILSFWLANAQDDKAYGGSAQPEYHLITFSSENHDKFASNVIRSAPLAGFNKTRHFKPADLDPDFLKENEWVFGDVSSKDW